MRRLLDWWLGRTYFDDERKLLVTGKEQKTGWVTVRSIAPELFVWRYQAFRPGQTYGLPQNFATAPVVWCAMVNRSGGKYRYTPPAAIIISPATRAKITDIRVIGDGGTGPGTCAMMRDQDLETFVLGTGVRWAHDRISEGGLTEIIGDRAAWEAFRTFEAPGMSGVFREA